VQIGITESLHRIVFVIQYFAYEPSIMLSATREDPYGSVSGGKMNTDLITPVSGTIIELNGNYDKDISATYTKGWQAIIRLSNPDELNRLYTPQYYAYLEAPTWSGPVPPMY